MTLEFKTTEEVDRFVDKTLDEAKPFTCFVDDLLLYHLLICPDQTECLCSFFKDRLEKAIEENRMLRDKVVELSGELVKGALRRSNARSWSSGFMGRAPR
jgi:hypothetical protein